MLAGLAGLSKFNSHCLSVPGSTIKAAQVRVLGSERWHQPPAAVTHLTRRFFTNSSMLIFSMRMKSPSPTLVWSAMVADRRAATHWSCAVSWAVPLQPWRGAAARCAVHQVTLLCTPGSRHYRAASHTDTLSSAVRQPTQPAAAVHPPRCWGSRQSSWKSLTPSSPAQSGDAGLPSLNHTYSRSLMSAVSRHCTAAFLAEFRISGIVVLGSVRWWNPL